MRAVLQRVSRASVSIDDTETARIGPGLAVFVCVEDGDGEAEVDLFTRKIAAMRIFEDDAGKMNRSVTDVGDAALVVSQFTLAAEMAINLINDGPVTIWMNSREG